MNKNYELPISSDAVWDPEDTTDGTTMLGVAILLTVCGFLWFCGGVAVGYWLWA